MCGANEFHDTQADRALCELRESIRARQRELLTEKRKHQVTQYRPKVFCVCVCLCLCACVCMFIAFGVIVCDCVRLCVFE